MRALVKAAAEVLAGSADAIPLADATVDAVLVGQAFHWSGQRRGADGDPGCCAPTGPSAWLWNRIGGGAPWVAEIARIMREHSATMNGRRHGPGARI